MSETEQEQGEIFGPEHHAALVRNAPEIHETLRQFIHKCWYTDELLVVDQPLEKNQPLFHDWICQELGEEFEVVSITADMLMTAEELLQQVLEELGLESEDDALATTLLQALNQGASDRGERPTELLIQVENAHELSEGVLTELLALISGHDEQLTPHIALWGDMRQTDALHSLESDEQARIGLLRIPPFSPKEVHAYLEHCWSQFESDLDFPFSKAQVASMLDEVGGAIDELDELALDQLEGESGGWHLPRWHAVAVAVLVVLLLFIFLRKDDEPADNGSRVVTLDLPPAATVNEPSQPETEQEEVANIRESAVPAPVVEESVEEPAVDVAQTEAPDQEEPLSPAEPATRAEVTEELEEPEVAVTVLPPEPEPAEQSTSADELLSHPDSDVFLQLLGSYSSDAAEQFMADNQRINGNGGQMYLFESRYQERPWFVVVYGAFSDRSEAEKVKGELPRHLQLAEPWARSMADIRSAMIR